MAARWEDTLDVQSEIANFILSETGLGYIQGFMMSLYGLKEIDPEWVSDSALALLQNVRVADPIFIDPEMMPLVRAATRNFAPEPLYETDLITPFGFIYLPEPLYLTDVRGRKLGIRVINWSKVIGYPYDTKEKDEELASFLRAPASKAEELGRPLEIWMPNKPSQTPLKPFSHRSTDSGIFLSLWSNTQDVDDYALTPEMGYTERQLAFITNYQKIHPYALSHLTPWVFGSPIPADLAHNALNEIHAVIKLLNQTVTMRTHERASKGFRRRAEKAELAQHNITIIRLRRPRHAQNMGEHHDVEWTHRWMVSGHWRKQPYPSLGKGVTRQIWISQYIKGPDDKPLVLRDARVFELVR